MLELLHGAELLEHVERRLRGLVDAGHAGRELRLPQPEVRQRGLPARPEHPESVPRAHQWFDGRRRIAPGEGGTPLEAISMERERLQKRPIGELPGFGHRLVREVPPAELADETVADARAFAHRALLEALPLHADRLEGRAALARGGAAAAVEPLTRARDGFTVLGARWEVALADHWLGEAQFAADIPGARESAQAALDVFEALGSVCESEDARSLLGRTG